MRCLCLGALMETAVESLSKHRHQRDDFACSPPGNLWTLKPKQLSSALGGPSALQLQAASEAAARLPEKSQAILLSQGAAKSLPRGLLDVPGPPAEQSHKTKQVSNQTAKYDGASCRQCKCKYSQQGRYT